jgi:hypothetical protein
MESCLAWAGGPWPMGMMQIAKELCKIPPSAILKSYTCVLISIAVQVVLFSFFPSINSIVITVCMTTNTLSAAASLIPQKVRLL